MARFRGFSEPDRLGAVAAMNWPSDRRFPAPVNVNGQRTCLQDSKQFGAAASTVQLTSFGNRGPNCRVGEAICGMSTKPDA